MNERKMTVKQQAFADNYIELGNATEAYLKAYTNVKKEATARANGSRLLTNANVSAYIENRMEELKSERVADQQEILETLTAVLRGEANGAALVGMGMGEQYMKKDMKPSVAERVKAAELLGKRHKLWTDKVETEVTGAVQFIDDISGDGNDG
ncbi:terminase small subunit [Sporosarcina limicola]|uniref:Phage terminase small subunit n=1 Tax=Sporosarcina limicola TaxID=34101 RepID=A0A927R382_9BACL|nr:terminase small subunit [Sporosarcina limicola]MBE1554791.1 phage terminase small subunit [Sporosarcina limicola]